MAERLPNQFPHRDSPLWVVFSNKETISRDIPLARIPRQTENTRPYPSILGSPQRKDSPRPQTPPRSARSSPTPPHPPAAASLPRSASLDGRESDARPREPTPPHGVSPRPSKAHPVASSSATPTPPPNAAGLPCTAGADGREYDTRPPEPTLSYRISPIPGTALLLSSSSIAPQATSSSATSTPPPDAANFRPVNPKSSKKYRLITPDGPVIARPRPLAPAPPRTDQPLIPRHIRPQPLPPKHYEKTFYGIPPEIRVEIYRLVLENVTLHILPRDAELRQRAPHPLTRVSRVVRNEVLPIIHSSCPIKAEITDFNFTGMLAFMARIPPQDQRALLKNNNLKIELCTASEKGKSFQKAVSDSQSLRTWLHARADQYRVQPKWQYCGLWPGRKVESDIRRRIKRMTEEGKKKEMIELAKGIGLQRVEDLPKPRERVLEGWVQGIGGVGMAMVDTARAAEDFQAECALRGSDDQHDGATLKHAPLASAKKRGHAAVEG